MGVYKITSKSLGKMYIGSSVDIGLREKRHMNNLKNNRHTNHKLQDHYNRFGKEDILFEVVEIVNDVNDLIPAEQRWMTVLQTVLNGFNICPTAGNTLGYRHTDKTKKFLSRMQIGKKLSAEQKRKIGNSLMGKIVTEETRRKISESNKGKPKSESHKQKMSQSAKKRKPISEETRQKLSHISKNRIRTKEWCQKISNSNKTPILQYDLSHNVISEYDSVKDASIKTGIIRTSISNVLNGKSKTAGGFIWEYKS